MEGVQQPIGFLVQQSYDSDNVLQWLTHRPLVDVAIILKM